MKVSVEEAGKVRCYRERIEHRYDAHYYNARALMCHRTKVPKLLFDEIIVKGEENVRRVQDKQLIYASKHVSMADYLIQGYIFWRDKLPIPRFLAGENLNRFPFGNFFRKCGAVYIDRNEKDPVYWAFEDHYIKKILFNNESLWFCPEGTRTDKLSEELKTGTIGQLIDVIKEGRDMYVIPVYPGYDKRIEEWSLPGARKNKKLRDEFLREARRLKRGGEDFKAWTAGLKAKIRDKIYFNMDLMAYIARPFAKEKGNAYLTFGEPFSIQDFLRENCHDGRREKLALTDKIREELKKLSQGKL